MLFCGIDTSNYTTSAALCNELGEILANIKIPLPVKDGERGLRQSDAVFAHIKNLSILTEKLKDALDGRAIDAVTVSSKPRDAEDSYMPCFLSGLSAAVCLPWVRIVRFIPPRISRGTLWRLTLRREPQRITYLTNIQHLLLSTFPEVQPSVCLLSRPERSSR